MHEKSQSWKVFFYINIELEIVKLAMQKVVRMCKNVGNVKEEK